MSVSVNKGEIFKRSWANLQVHAIAGIVLTLLILAAMEQILRTEAKARQKAEQLQLTLENMSQGIMLVTKDLQIPIINSRCGELLNLPAEFIEHPPRFDQLVEFQAQIGELPGPGDVDRANVRSTPGCKSAAGGAIHDLRTQDAERHRDRGSQRTPSRRQLRADLHRRHQAVARRRPMWRGWRPKIR